MNTFRHGTICQERKKISLTRYPASFHDKGMRDLPSCLCHQAEETGLDGISMTTRNRYFGSVCIPRALPASAPLLHTYDTTLFWSGQNSPSRKRGHHTTVHLPEKYDDLFKNPFHCEMSCRLQGRITGFRMAYRKRPAADMDKVRHLLLTFSLPSLV